MDRAEKLEKIAKNLEEIIENNLDGYGLTVTDNLPFMRLQMAAGAILNLIEEKQD